MSVAEDELFRDLNSVIKKDWRECEQAFLSPRASFRYQNIAAQCDVGCWQIGRAQGH